MPRQSCVLAGALCTAIVLPLWGQEPSERQALFGDLHIHTHFSFDAFTGSVRTTPDDAYLFAKGHPIAHPSGETMRITGRPLDFLAVTDHAEFLGVHAALLDPTSPTYGHPATDEVLPKPGATLVSAIRQMRELIASGDPIAGKEVIASAWKKTVESAERHNDPGTFTTLIGFEYTPGVGGRHLHRNVIFRGAEVPDQPFSSRDSENPEDLWTWLDSLRDDGIEALAVPHNMNQSDGLAFQETTFGGEPIDRGWAEKRHAQRAGRRDQSKERHLRNASVAVAERRVGRLSDRPVLSESCREQRPDLDLQGRLLPRRPTRGPRARREPGCQPVPARRRRRQRQPYERRLLTKKTTTSATAATHHRHVARAYREADGGWGGYFTPRQATHGTGGLTGVWAEENTRTAIYDAMRRKESFGTSGPRIRVRLFGGFGLDRALGGAADPIAEALP